ncbi:uncharacterized protein LOC126647327 isoform X2 [Myiozetetes cayanensis]|uniref:uncharacterized protein LOC126647327 isoform X2 n=1 Tax=Myiozetetes cayanensis TaxID=478635 RepID=UPI00215E2C26|nr:uncharacterized protein LOC126647327 isoform X2 [Myiozetetes cayanensis]
MELGRGTGTGTRTATGGPRQPRELALTVPRLGHGLVPALPSEQLQEEKTENLLPGRCRAVPRDKGAKRVRSVPSLRSTGVWPRVAIRSRLQGGVSSRAR